MRGGLDGGERSLEPAGIAAADVEGVAESDDLLDAGTATQDGAEGRQLRAGYDPSGEWAGGDDLGDGAVGEQFAIGQIGEAVATLGLVHIVRGDEDGQALGGEPVDFVPELAAGFGINSGGGFIEEK